MIVLGPEISPRFKTSTPTAFIRWKYWLSVICNRRVHGGKSEAPNPAARLKMGEIRRRCQAASESVTNAGERECESVSVRELCSVAPFMSEHFILDEKTNMVLLPTLSSIVDVDVSNSEHASSLKTSEQAMSLRWRRETERWSEWMNACTCPGRLSNCLRVFHTCSLLSAALAVSWTFASRQSWWISGIASRVKRPVRELAAEKRLPPHFVFHTRPSAVPWQVAICILGLTPRSCEDGDRIGDEDRGRTLLSSSICVCDWNCAWLGQLKEAWDRSSGLCRSIHEW